MLRIRLYLDEDVLPELARILRARGFDVVSAPERGTGGWSDPEQLAFAATENRAILTFNFVDFQRLGDEWFADQRPHAGIIVSYRQYSRRQIGDLARVVIAFLNQVSAEELASTVRVLDEFAS